LRLLLFVSKEPRYVAKYSVGLGASGKFAWPQVGISVDRIGRTAMIGAISAE
jgi:hypothetical protein